MKKLIVFLIVMFILSGCNEKYSLVYGGTFIPDSNKTKYTEYVQKVVSAASYHMTTADYEDPEDLVRAARNSANELFSVTYYELYYTSSWNSYCIKHDQMTPEESKIYDSLLNVRSKNFNRAIQ